MDIPLHTNLFPYWFFPWNTNTWQGFTDFIFHKELLAIDAIRQIFIWKNFAFMQLQNSNWPLWNPHNFSGHPLLANFQTGVFYPFSWLFYFLSSKEAWSVYIYLQFPLVVLFMFIFLKGHMNKRSALFGALVLLFSSFYSTRYFWGVYIHTILWLPLVLHLTDRFINKTLKIANYVVLVSLVISVALLGGYPQFAVYIFILHIGYFLFKTTIKNIKILCLTCLLPLIVCAVQLIPTWELYSNSLRDNNITKDVFVNALVDPKYLLTSIFPDYWGNPATNNFTEPTDYSGINFYIGVIPLIFAISSLVELKKNRIILFWVVVSFGGFVMATNNVLAQIPNRLSIPILSSSNPWNNLFFWQFGLVILASYGLNKWTESSNKYPITVACALLILQFFIIVMNQNHTQMRNMMLYSAISLITIILLMIQNKFKYLLLITFFTMSGFYYLSKMSPFGEERYFFPKHEMIEGIKNKHDFMRLLGFDKAQFASNLATYYGVYDTSGYDSLWPKYYGELIASGLNDGLLPNKINRADVLIFHSNNASSQLLVDLFSNKYIMSYGDENNTHMLVSSKFRLIQKWDKLFLFENLSAYPRTWLASNSLNFTNKESLLKNMFSGKHDLKKNVLLKNNYLQIAGDCFNCVSKITHYSPGTIEISVGSNKKNILIINENFFPGWTALANNESVDVFPVNHSMLGVVVDSKVNKVRLEYKPKSFVLGQYITLLGLTILLCISYYKKSFSKLLA